MADPNNMIAMSEIHCGPLNEVQEGDLDSCFSKGNVFAGHFLPVVLPVFPASPAAGQSITQTRSILGNQDSGRGAANDALADVDTNTGITGDEANGLLFSFGEGRVPSVLNREVKRC